MIALIQFLLVPLALLNLLGGIVSGLAASDLLGTATKNAPAG
jgi:hypothetical protein